MKTKMIIKRAALLLTFSSMAAFTLSARAQIWYAPTPITPDGVADVQINGTLIAAYNFVNGDGHEANWFNGNVTLNGLSFTAVPYDNPPAGVTFISNVTATDIYFESSSVSSGEYKAIVGSGIFIGENSNEHPLALTLNNLTVGSTYQVKFWVQDERVANGNGRYLTFYTGGVQSPDVWANQNAAANYLNVGNMIVCEFTADTDSQMFIIQGGTPVTNAFLNALVLSVIPEPSTWALLLGGAGLLALLRRQRAA